MLRVTYQLVDDLGPGEIVEIREKRGAVDIRLSRTATLQQVVDTLNEVCEELLAGGQWFQLWKGEIVTLDSPADPRGGGTVARLHRGPLVQEGSAGPQRSQGKAHTG